MSSSRDGSPGSRFSSATTPRRPTTFSTPSSPRDGDAPGRKVYQCASCDASLGGAPERVAPVDAGDLAKLGIEGDPPAGASDLEAVGELDDDLPPAPTGLT